MRYQLAAGESRDPSSVPAARLFGVMPVNKHGPRGISLDKVSQCGFVCVAELGIYQQGNLVGDNPVEVAVNRALTLCWSPPMKNSDKSCSSISLVFGDDTSTARGKEALPAAATRLLDGIGRALGRKTAPGPYVMDQVSNVTNPFPGLDALGFDRSGYPKINAQCFGWCCQKTQS
jgi:hypothetical protein